MMYLGIPANATNCKNAEAQRAYYLAKMWATPIFTAERAKYEKKANAWAALVAKCMASGGSTGGSKKKGGKSHMTTYKESKASASSAPPPPVIPPSVSGKFSPSTTASMPGMGPGASPADGSAFQPAVVPAQGPNWLLILGGVAVVGGGYYLYKHRKARASGAV